MKQKIHVVAALAVLSSCAAACSKSPAEPDAGPRAEVTPASPQSTRFGATLESPPAPTHPPPAGSAPTQLPSYFPDYTPIYPMARIVETEQGKSDAGGPSNIVRLQTTDSLPRVQAWYDNVAKGFNEISEKEEPTAKSYWLDDSKRGGHSDIRIYIHAFPKATFIRVAVEPRG